MLYCPNCGKEVLAATKFCASCGAELQRAPLATTPSPGYVPPSPLADLGSRIVAGIIDYIIIGVVAIVLAILLLVPTVITEAFMMSRFRLGLFRGMFGIVVIMWFLWLAYFTYFEGTSGQTIGKRVSKIKVMKENGSRCDLSSALVRNILRIVDHLPFLYLLGIILIAATEKKQRLGDMLAKTIVVKA